jgi:pimeloyl-ACP methyl ester carboxylesterase
MISSAVAFALLGASIISPSSSTSATTLPQVVVCGGFRIPARHYSSIVDSFVAAGYSSPVVIEQVDDGETLGESAQRALSSMVGKGAVILIGHSRGGAVALRIAFALQERAISVILLDPVDDRESSTINLAVASPSLFLPPRVLVISTPYAGASAFYHETYQSACAPAGRNGDSFAAALGDRAVHLTMPNTGHLEILDFRKDLAVSNLCGPSSKLAPEKTYQLDKAVLRLLPVFAQKKDKGALEELKLIDPEIMI